MWNYEKRLQYPVKITQTNPKIAKIIISQFGGPDGELAASMRYLSQRYTMPYKEVTGTLTDIGTEELAHMEMGHRLSAHQGPFSGGNRTLRICSLLCRSHTCSLATGSKRRPMDSNLFPIKRRSHHRSS